MWLQIQGHNSHLLTQVHRTQLGRLNLGIHHYVEHGADGLWHAEVCGPTALLKLGLKRCSSPLEMERRETTCSEY